MYPRRQMRSPASLVSLREITAEIVDAVANLSTTEEQSVFVQSNAVSLAQANLAPEAWCRAIYLQECLVGFVMLYDESMRAVPPADPELWVWRLMVDASYQGRGIGRAAMLKVIEHAKTKSSALLQLSYVPAQGHPALFYSSLGFRHTSRIQDGEIVLELPLTNAAAA
jgi:diamine N-acetyltransferase